MDDENYAVPIDVVVSGLAGGGRRGPIYMPAVVADVHPDMRISRDELFGPAVAVTPAWPR